MDSKKLRSIIKEYNLPITFSLTEAIVYIDNLKEIEKIEQSKINTGYLEVLKNSNHYIIKRHLETINNGR
jgi:hypothetical protein